MRRGHMLRLPVAVLVVWAVAAAILAAGCSGGDDGSASTATSVGGGAVELTPTTEEEVSVLTTLDKLTTFRSKDPFIPQAVVPSSASSTTVSTIPTTTTTLPPVTTASTTTSTTSTTTTTAPHVLTLLDVTDTPSLVVEFDIDGWTFSGQTVGAIVSGAWGVIEVTAIDADPGTLSATFERNGLYEYVLDLITPGNDWATW